MKMHESLIESIFCVTSVADPFAAISVDVDDLCMWWCFHAFYTLSDRQPQFSAEELVDCLLRLTGLTWLAL